MPFQSFDISIRFLYLGEIAADLGDGEPEQAILAGIDKLGKQLEIPHLIEGIFASEDRRLARQLRSSEVERGQAQLKNWFTENVLGNKVMLETARASDVKWDHSNSIFADVLLQADEHHGDTESASTLKSDIASAAEVKTFPNGVPIGPASNSSTSTATQHTTRQQRSVLFPAHRAMLLRSEYFNIMFSSSFREAQETSHLQIIRMDCSPAVLEVVLTFLYTETADIPLELAVETVYAADMLYIDKLKMKAAVIISTLGNGTASVVEAHYPRGEVEIHKNNNDNCNDNDNDNDGSGNGGNDNNDGAVKGTSSRAINVYEVLRAGWTTHLHRLEEFAARYIAHRLEYFIDEEEFLEVVRESAERIVDRQETDTIELIDEYGSASISCAVLDDDDNNANNNYDNNNDNDCGG